MARDRANINTNIWTDTHWRQLTRDQQWLYKLILTHPELSYAGVSDWRPGRLMQFSAGTSRQEIERIGAELQAERFILIDEDTEEVLIRSFLRHDGILKQPKLTVSMVNAYAAVASNNIREVIVYELARLHKEAPETKAFENPKVLALLKHPARPMEDFTQGFTPSFTLDVTPAFTPKLSQAQALPTTTATTTATYPLTGVSASGEVEREAGRTGTRIPKGFAATAQMIAWALENTPNINWQSSTKKFKAHYNSAAGPAQFKTDWESAWQSWLLGDQERAETRPQQFKTAAERKLDAGAAMHAKYSAIEEQNQLALEGGP
ncbi:hypothetical protein ART_1587 [Arthrobacter sp. PAMC 25486]|uniref:hypothetical protein n=1 Tax=Arthrobacter sp. PAMC 25486 TaxID=1494608 RepID=UPI0005359FC7|nr:hypothetical protein [Arthrobacter sp. PAMC 25486]AIY01186.1 hypothetical protein ART_1587 [Arthrobacter sp. PAMC 25486]